MDPGELEVLRRKDGAFWQFVTQVLSPVVRGARDGLVAALSRSSRAMLLPPAHAARAGAAGAACRSSLWDDEGKPRPLAMQVRPLPLPTAPTPDSFVTLSYLKCGGAASFGFNQRPAWGSSR